MRKLHTIKPLSNYLLQCVFSDGTTKIADIKPFLDKEAFKSLKDPALFEFAIHNGGYFVEWKNLEIDLSADTLSHISKTV
jgi:hypothetical protein